MEIRSFLAFELPSDIKRVVSHVSEEMRKSLLDVRWVKVNNIHITVVFIGNILEEHLRPMGKTVAEVCQRYGSFSVSLKGAGIFSSRKTPRVIWIRLEGDLERMSYFRDALQAGLKPFGIKIEKRQFKPHLTLGRFRKGAKPGVYLDKLLSRYQNLSTPLYALGELTLFRSDLDPKGAVYTKLNSWPLVGTH